MTHKAYFRSKAFVPFRTSLLAALLCTGAMVAGMLPVSAQESDQQQQLPADFANQQVPPTFPSVNDDGTQPVKPAVSAAATSQSAKPGEGGEVPADKVPAQPTEKKLVPAKAMGVGVQDDRDQATGEGETAPTDTADDAPAMPDILEKYAAKAKEKEPAENGDALPKADAPVPPMAKIEGGFSPDDQVSADAADKTESKEALKQEIRSEAFDAAMTGVFPLTPEQIEKLLKQYDVTQKAVKTPVYEAPKPEISVENISLDPGVLPPTIKTAVGNVTTLNILDATGAPWPVQDVTWAGDFEVVEPEEGGHVVRITPMSHFARGNIVIRLLTLKTPLTLTLETSRDVVQYRVDARVPEYGPFANAPLMEGAGGKSSMVAGNSDLTSVLDGAMPSGMVKLDVVGTDGRTTAYSLNGTTYVRTPLTLLSPAWQSSVSSADGMNVYALSNAPVVLLSDGGSFIQATLKEKEDLLDE